MELNLATDSENSCPHCGDLVNLEDAFCHNCGGSIKEEIEVQPLEGVPRKLIIPTEKLLEIDELVKKSNVAKIQWVATVTDLSIEEITSACSELGFVIKGENIFSPEIRIARDQKAVYTPPIKQITYGKTREKIYGKSNHWASVGIAFLVIAVILYAFPMPCVSLYGGFPVGVVAIICSFISLFTPRQRKKSIIVFVFSLLATIVWGTQYLLIFGFYAY